MSTYYSDRTLGAPVRSEEAIPPLTWGGVAALINRLISNGAFAAVFPADCPDGRGVTGTDEQMMRDALLAEVPDLEEWPLRPSHQPPTMAVLDLLEFSYRAVASPVNGSFHSFFGHYHLGFNVEEGRREFRDDVNRLLARGKVAYELGTDGLIRRLVPEAVMSVIAPEFKTGDATLDEMLRTARDKFLDRSPSTRREALEKLWDAFERLKTIEPGADKKSQVKILLDRTASEPMFRNVLEQEAQTLTKIGNDFLIRHAETNKVAISSDRDVDYLFHRLFAFVRLTLRATGRSA